MTYLNTKQLRSILSAYASPNTALALGIVITDLLIYCGAIAGVIFLDNLALRLLCCFVAGSMIASLFVIGHDAAHQAFTGSRTLNKIIGRIVFLPSLHNYGLWCNEHNRIHHQSTNVKNLDSWSPFSKQEYDALPGWRRNLEKFYRSVPGIGFYYMIERWWKNKFYPFEGVVDGRGSVGWDFALLVFYLGSYLGLLVYFGRALDHTNPFELILLGFVVPFLNWNFMMGFTVYQHHTNELIPWSRSLGERDEMGGQEDFTVHVRYPKWYDLFGHNIMHHVAHHVDPRIPLYHLVDAQKRLAEVMADRLHTIPFTVGGFLNTLKTCKLYDYERHRWLDFDGNVTGCPVISMPAQQPRIAA